MKINKLALVLAFVLTTMLSFGQDTRKITGVVLDENDAPVIGATVRVLGTQYGTITDIDGSYVLDIPADVSEIQVSYLGEPTLVAVTGDVVDVQLGPSDFDIEQVVVTGYTTESKRTFSGSAKSVGAQINEDKNTSDVTEALAGEVAGVTVINTSGQPGTPARVRIRGFGSVNGNRSPLYVVDGVPFNGDIAAINPADIESQTVLKDASATALYGSRGANGVIVINTKKGKSGESKISVDVKRGINTRFSPYYDVITSPETYMETVWDGYYQEAVAAGNANPGTYASQNLFDAINPVYNIWDIDGQNLIDPATGRVSNSATRKYTPENRRELFFEDQPRTEANLQFSGGNDGTTYAASLGYLQDKGYFVGSDFKRYSGGLRLAQEIKPWLNGDINLNYGRTISDDAGQSSASSLNGFYIATRAPSIYGVFLRDLEGNVVQHPTLGVPTPDYGVTTAREFQQFANIYGTANYDISNTAVGNLGGKAELVADLGKKVQAIGRFGYQNYEDDYNSVGNKFFGQREGSGFLTKTKTEINSFTFLQMLKYDDAFFDDQVGLTAYVAHENNDYERQFITTSGVDLVDPSGTDFATIVTPNATTNSFTTDYNLESYFAIANVDFKERYFLNGSIRHDGSSKFRKENRWGTFASVGGAWLASDEKFLSDSNWLNYLKLRASWGQTGDQDGAPTYSSGGNLFSISPLSEGNYALVFDTFVDPNLTWEKQRQYDFGAEVSIFERVDLSLDYFNKKTTDLFFTRRNPPSSGVATQLVNDGELLNKGFEFDVTGHIIKADKPGGLNLDLTANGTTLKNELLTLPIDPVTNKPKVLTDEGTFAFAKGKSIFDFYIPEFVGVNPDNGLSLFTQYYDDKNSNGEVDAEEIITDLVTYKSENPDANIAKTTTENLNEATQFFTGESAIPDLRGATRLEGTFKGFGLSTQLLYSVGGYGLDANYQGLMHNLSAGKFNWHNDIANRWRQPGDVTNVPRIDNNSTAESAYTSRTSTRFLTKMDYLLLNNVRVSYTLPKDLLNKLNIQRATVSFSGDNLWSKSQRDGYTPWTYENGTSSSTSYTPLSTFTGGVNFTF